MNNHWKPLPLTTISVPEPVEAGKDDRDNLSASVRGMQFVAEMKRMANECGPTRGGEFAGRMVKRLESMSGKEIEVLTQDVEALKTSVEGIVVALKGAKVLAGLRTMRENLFDNLGDEDSFV